MNPLVLLLFIGGASAAAVGGYVAYDHYIIDEAQKPAPVAAAQPTGTPSEQEPALEPGTTAADVKSETNEPQIKEEVEVAAVDPQQEETPAEIKTAEPKVEEPVIKEPEIAVVPSFDVVRIEKGGDAVIAGQAAPNSTVNLVNNGEIIAQTKADTTGAFVIIPDKPFSGDGNEIWLSAVKEEDKLIQSKQVVAIAVDGAKTPLVVLVEEGKPASILQVPEAEETAVVEAPAEPETAEETKVADIVPRAKPSDDVESVEAETEPAKTAVAAVEPEVVEPEEITEAQPVPVAEPATDATEATREVEIVEEANEAPVNDATPAEVVQEETQETVVASAPAAESLPTPEPDPEPSAPATLVEPTGNVSVDAVETEKDKIFIAGTSSPGKTVRVYVEDELVGDAKTNNEGRWLLEDKKELEPGNYNIRADELRSSGRVDSRAEVPFSVSETNEVRLKPLDPTQGRRVIIRRNDNLWTISRRLYGDGQRFTAIYTQNKEQIRNPNLIFPGQVFELPDEALAPLQGPEGPDNKG